MAAALTPERDSAEQAHLLPSPPWPAPGSPTPVWPGNEVKSSKEVKHGEQQSLRGVDSSILECNLEGQVSKPIMP